MERHPETSAPGGASSRTVPSRTVPSWGRRLVGVEGLRGLAAVSVVVGHVRLYTATPYDLGPFDRIVRSLDGLTLFFALSGFLLFRPFAAAVVSDAPRPRTGAFFRNRALRVYPAYVVVLVLAAFVLRTTYTVGASAEGLDSWRAALGVPRPWVLAADLTMLQTLLPGSMLSGLGVAWSLTTELCFYLVLPGLAAVATARARRRGGRRAVWLVPAVLLGVGWLGKGVVAATAVGDTYARDWGPTWDAVLARSLLVHADLFGWGALAAVVFVLLERGLLRAGAVRHVRLAAAVVFVVGAALTVEPELLGPLRPLEDSVTAAACAALVLLACLPTSAGSPSWTGRALDARPLALAGLTSYSAYLWHLPVLWWLLLRGWTFPTTPLGYVGNAAVVLTATFGLSAVTYRLVEAPALRRKQRTDGGRGAAGGPAVGDGPLDPYAADPARPRDAGARRPAR